MIYVIIPFNWIGGCLPLLRRSGSPFNLTPRCVLENASRSSHRIFSYRTLFPGVFFPLAFTPELWPLLRSLLLTLLIFVVKLRFRIRWTLMHALHRRWATRSTAAFNF